MRKALTQAVRDLGAEKVISDESCVRALLRDRVPHDHDAVTRVLLLYVRADYLARLSTTRSQLEVLQMSALVEREIGLRPEVAIDIVQVWYAAFGQHTDSAIRTRLCGLDETATHATMDTAFRRLAVATGLNEIHVWELAPTPHLVETFSIPGKIGTLCLNSDGLRVAVAQGEKRALSIYGPPGNTISLRTIPDVTAVASTPEGKYIVVGRTDGSVATWTSELIMTGRIFSSQRNTSATALSVSCDGCLVASGWHSGTVEINNLSGQRRPPRTFQGSASVKALAFSSSGAYIAAVCEDGGLMIGEIATGQTATAVGAADALAWLPNEDSLVTGTQEGSVAHWDRKGLVVKRYSHPVAAPIRALVVTVDNVLAVTGGGEAMRWTLDSPTSVRFER